MEHFNESIDVGLTSTPNATKLDSNNLPSRTSTKSRTRTNRSNKSNSLMEVAMQSKTSTIERIHPKIEYVKYDRFQITTVKSRANSIIKK